MSARVAWWALAEAPAVMGALGRSRESLGRQRDRRLQALLAAARRTPLHSGRLPADADDPWSALAGLPVATKEDLREAGSAACLGGRLDPSWLSSTSSGSTGEPFRVHYDPRAWAVLKHLVKLRGRRVCGVGPRDRVAILDAVLPGARRRGALEHLGRVRVLSVLAPADVAARELAAFAPDAVYGPPSALLDVARALARAGTARRVPRTFTSGELLLDAVRDEIARLLGARVFDVYGTSETKEIAFECRRGGLHANWDVVHVEVTGDDGRPLPDGTEGDLVVTSLVNHAMPLLRYRTGDRGSLVPGPCPCGLHLPRMGVVTGRAVDALRLPDGTRVSPYALTCAVERVAGVRRFQVVQTAPSVVRLRAQCDPAVPAAAVEAGLRDAVVQATRGLVAAEVEFVEGFERQGRGKFRVVQGLAG
jgi:phenylacetate-CoA ligase